jgi:hypothetical protein
LEEFHTVLGFVRFPKQLVQALVMVLRGDISHQAARNEQFHKTVHIGVLRD